MTYDAQADFSAVGDGVANDGPAIRAMLAQIAADGGGAGHIPPGTYLLDNRGDGLALAMPDKCQLFGAGVGVSTLRLGDGQNAHILQMDGSRQSVRDLSFDGNRANQTNNYHCVRSLGLTRGRVFRCEMFNAGHYGIGLQGGTFNRVWLDDLDIHDVGGDGIDIKNKNQNNEMLFLSRITVENFGLLGETSTVYAGLDMRGLVHATDIFVRGLPYESVGVRFRFGESDDLANGYGAHRSQLRGVNVISASPGLRVGVSIESRNVDVDGGYLEGLWRGVAVMQFEPSIRGVKAIGCGVGFHAEGASTLTSNGDRVSFIGGSARSCNIGFDLESDNCILIGNQLRGNTTGVRNQPTADGTVLGDNVFTSNTTHLSDSGTNTKKSNNVGI